MLLGDRISILRKGKKICTLDRKKDSITKLKLARLMVGREFLFKMKKQKIQPGRIILKVEELYALNDLGLTAISNISFNIHANEIFGLAGVAGNGQKELIEVLTGLRNAIKGKVFLYENDITNKSSRDIANLGVAHIPEDRLNRGVISDLSIAKNLILRKYCKPPISKGLFLDKLKIEEYAKKLISKYNIITPNIKSPVKFLSGGNLQRLILARETYEKPNLIIASHPTYGLDISATEKIRELLINYKEKGTGILLISEDLDEVYTLSDRIAVIFEGKIVGIKNAEEVKIEELGMMLGGLKSKGSMV
jgi:simple sugar transport system ATP-binding protein